MSRRILAVAYALVSLANVVAYGAGAAGPAKVTKALLMPLLLAWLLVSLRGAGRGRGAPRWLAVGLVFAWLGDLLLSGEGQACFMAGIGAFLLMQVSYIVAFSRAPGPGLVRSRKLLALPYVVLWALLNQLMSGGVGALRIPVLVYSAVLVGMAIAALDQVGRVDRSLGWRIAIGAPIFVASDGLIALTTFGPLSPSRGMDVAIMATYVVAQGMIVSGMAGVAAGAPAASSTSILAG